MSNPLNLIPGQTYTVVQPFTDYDAIHHPAGETWTFIETNFLPYEDGLTLHVVKDGIAVTYRLQWRAEEQAPIIENFKNYVEPD